MINHSLLARILEDDVHSLSISKGDFPEFGYIKNAKWSKQTAFTVRTKLKSSIYPQDPRVNKYLVEYCRPGKGIEALHDLREVVNNPETITFLPIIFNTLFRLLCDGDDAHASAAFKTIMELLKGYGSSGGNERLTFVSLNNPGTQSILNYYATYLFDNTTKPAFEQIAKYWLAVEDGMMDGFKTYWFLFSIITKSMALHLFKLGKLKSKKRYEQFSLSFQTNLEALLPKLLVYAGSTSVITFPVFITSLFGMLSTGSVFKLV